MSSTTSSPLARIGVLIRYKDSARTLPGVLAALRAQTLQPDLIVGVDNGSTDGSTALLEAAGALIVEWPHPYHHSKVLNLGFTHCRAERVLVVSSHTVLEAPDTLERLNRALDDPATACASGKWDADPYYSDAITWEELKEKGLKLGSIYSNSFGLMKRALWEEVPFDENVPPIEDYVWVVEQIHRGHICRRLDFPYSYQRQARSRDFQFASGVFALAARYGLKVSWRGRKSTLLEMVRLFFKGSKTEEDRAMLRTHRARLLASLVWRWSG